MIGPLTPEIQAKLRTLGATDDEIARLGSLNNQHGIEWDNLFALLASQPAGLLGRLLSIFQAPVPPIRLGP